MKWLGKIRLLTYAVIVAAVVCYLLRNRAIPANLTSSDTRTVVPRGVWYRFEDSAAFPPPFCDAAPAVLAAVKKEGLEPDRYFIRFDYEDEKKLKFALWDVGAFPTDPTVKGDPTGKCRSVEYDTEKKEVTRIFRWR